MINLKQIEDNLNKDALKEDILGSAKYAQAWSPGILSGYFFCLYSLFFDWFVIFYIDFSKNIVFLSLIVV